MFHPFARYFQETYRCYPVTMMPGNDRENVTFGGKILLPPSALQKLASLHIEYPMLFEITNPAHKKTTHAGVLEFIADEGRMYVPPWMMNTLLLEQGQLVTIKTTTLPLGKFVKIQPQSVDFLEITDPKAVLEQAFRNFTTLTEGDIISISYNSTIYDILVMETKPKGKGISIIETDLEVDFAAPLGYVEPERKKRDFSAFVGSGQRLNGKEGSTAYGAQSTTNQEQESDIPAVLNLPPGRLYFGYPVVPLPKEESKEPEKFSGSGVSLRQSKKK
ncbi:ubiquitin fusion degradation protein UFD1-containing protein [Gorgonomyces haynaldii]|nr:ubiquitin fusion degradation protein UFD1-containing protein [Gorgonomyces haynaldii]